MEQELDHQVPFTVALIKAIYSFQNRSIGHNELAEKACQIEIEDLRRNVGKQDQYSSVFGGINSYAFFKKGSFGSTSKNFKTSFRKIRR